MLDPGQQRADAKRDLLMKRVLLQRGHQSFIGTVTVSSVQSVVFTQTRA